MKWMLRFILWATLLAVPCWWISHGYQRLLARAAMGVLAAFGQSVEIDDIEVMAPFDLGLFAAMCLASRAAPRAARQRAFLVGLPTLAALEILTVVLGIAVYLVWPRNSPQLATSLRLTGNVIESIPWVSATLVWLLLLGAWELPVGAPSGSGRPGRAGKR
jgi:heme/copper-type cytochrome/quinol oxidase subunit 2